MNVRRLTPAFVAVAVASSVGLSAPASAAARMLEARSPATTCLLGTDDEPVGTGPCPGVRPGAWIAADEGNCTLNFIFRDELGRRYAGTAGHCTLSGQGKSTWRWGAGPSVRGPEREPIGRFVFAVVDGELDFGLIRLHEGVKADPEMCVFGGPSGIETGTRDAAFVLQYYGNGIGMGNANAVNQPTLPARSALASSMQDPMEVTAAGASIFGDSGAPVTAADNDRAVGVLVGFRPEGGIVVKRIGPAIAAAEAALRTDLRLVVAR